MISGLYAGRVGHTRLRPRRHRLRYGLFQLLLDLDELPALDRRLRLFGHNRRGLFAFLDRDHGDGSPTPLRAQVEARLAGAGLPTGGPIRILCMPRVLGRVFNPLSVVFCHRPDGALAAILYEVNNTFGQRHGYLIPVEPGQGAQVRQACDKAFYVSPFMGMALSYAFDVRPPGEEVFVGVRSFDADGPLLLATFRGRRRALTDGAILRAFASAPFQALQVLAAIHWEALRIWIKGARLHRRPPAPEQAVTLVAPAERRRAA